MTDAPDVHVKRLAAPSQVQAEAAGLRWLADARPAGGTRVVTVLSTSESELRLRRVPAIVPSRASAVDLGRSLARLHASGASSYGCPPPGSGSGWIASLPLPYGTWPTFGPFYAEARLRPYVRIARDRGSMTEAQSAVIDALCERLAGDDPAVCGPAEPPSRLHGDLWSGNVLWSTDGAVLIDPAAHGGHRETDLAMLALFGLPYLDDVLRAYDEQAPLAPGWRSRVSLHQVHPLLVHAALFGGSYAAGAVDAAHRALSA